MSITRDCIRALVPLLATAALLLPPAGAQDDPRDRPYPHGDWSEDCSLCHRDEPFLPIAPGKDFKHSPRFALQGAHRSAQCRACHATLDFSRPPASTSCNSCHQDVHRGEFGLDCARCHTPRSFIDRVNMVRSHRTYRFPLTGAHVTADCDACHRTGPEDAMAYLSLPTDCDACHLNGRLPTATQRPPATTHPDRADCLACHNTVSFDFNHARTGFALTGQHASVECGGCHGVPFNPDLDPACVSCHRDDYDGTTDPDHGASGFPTDCTLCHNTSGFEGADFRHSTTRFPLTGAHQALPCSACHADGVYAGRRTDCYACHQSMYESTRDPNHVVAGFDHDCTQCHSTTTFSGAQYRQHDGLFFPIYSGAHWYRWYACSDCHVNSGTYREFSCMTCHEQVETDDNHAGISNYRYDNLACYQCHPEGRQP